MVQRLLALLTGLCLLPAVPAAAEGDARGALVYETIIPPQYEDAEPFSEGYAAVRSGGKWGYIDVEGNTVLPFIYEKAYDFSEGLAVVSPNVVDTAVYELANGSLLTYSYYDLGVVDPEGNYTPFVYTDPYTRESAPVTVPDAFLPSELVYHNGYVRVSIPGNGGQLFDVSGRSVPLSGDLDHVTGPMNEGLAPAEGRMEGLVGWVDEQGHVIRKFYVESGGDASVQTFVSAVLPFNQGLAPAWQCTTDWNAGRSVYLLGFMDRDFEWVIEPQYTNYWRSGVYTDYEIFGETGLAMVAKGGRYGAIDMQGETVIPFRYEILGASSSGMILFREGGRYGYLDAETNEVAIEAQYMNATMFQNGLAIVYDGRSAFLIDRQGRVCDAVPGLDPAAYFQENEDSSQVAHSPGEYVVIRENGKSGFGRIRYTPPLPAAEELDAWALEEVSAAVSAGLVPNDLQCLYRQSITRAEFCALAVGAVCRAAGLEPETLVERSTGRSLSAWQRQRPFNDASSPEILAAYALGIVSGRGNGRFDPYAGITRQEAAVMLQKAAAAAGTGTAAADAGFSDAGEIASWAREAVDFAAASGVMRGTGGGAFSPLQSYTREQSYITVWRLFSLLRA